MAKTKRRSNKRVRRTRRGGGLGAILFSAAHAAHRSTKPSAKPLENAGLYKEPYDPVKGAAAREYLIERMQRDAQNEWLEKRKSAQTKKEKADAYSAYLQRLREVYD